jgi:hypothetical protein
VRTRRTPTRIATLAGAPPVEVLTTTARRHGEDPATIAIERGLRTAAAVATVPDGWQWPRWLDRQTRPGHPSFVAAGDVALVENVTGRDWRTVGTVSSGVLALVDPRGLVSPVHGGWTLDWLVAAEDRWHRPGRDAGVRQRLLDGAPVPETSCRVAGGDVVHRVYGATLGGDLGDSVVIEIENETSTPVAVAFALRPADLLAAGTITSIELDETRVVVDGRPAVLFERPPAHAVFGDAFFDSLTRVVANEAGSDTATSVRDPLGLAQAAFVVPVPHKTSVRVVLTTGTERRVGPVADAVVPPAAAVARGWATHAEQAARLELPDARLVACYEAAVRGMLLASGGGTVAAPVGREDRWTVADEADVVHTMQMVGLHEGAGAVVRSRGDEFELDGWFRREQPSLSRNASVFHAVAATWNLAGDRDTFDTVLGPTVKAAHWSERFRARRNRSIAEADAYASHDALAALATALAGVDQHEAAQDVAAFAARFVLDHERITDAAPADDRDLFVATSRGIDVRASVERATAWFLAGDERALPILGWLTEVGGTNGRWPTSVHPRLGTGSSGSGDDPAVAAAVARMALALAVHVDGTTVRLLPFVPESWLGSPIDVRGVPTPMGRCSFSVRWHGERPALLWELDGHDGRAVRITAPGLDPRFASVDPSGEALLAPPRTSAAAPPASFTAPSTVAGEPVVEEPIVDEPGPSFA